MNTQDQFSSPHQIEASKFYESDKVQILINSSDTISLAENTKESLNKIIVTVENHILPRLTKIWGNWYDVNSDGKITILFSSTINTEGVAIGFFNPNDFFQNKSDKSEDGYNPYSNEQDIIYLALPSDEKSYSENTIIATIAHELTHAINFTNKTYLPYSNNQTYQEEETFLDEGLSHLSENLCGFSISGGNIEEEWFYWSINLLGYKEMHKDEEVLYDGLLTNANVFLLESWVRYLEK